MKSQYDDKRDTVGSLYMDAQKTSTQNFELGEISRDMASSLADDINAAAESNPFEGRSFYLRIVEERDLQMPNAIKRRIFTMLYRPYPEDNTLVFYVDMQKDEIFYCWDLPHHSEIPNILIRAHEYDHQYISNIKDFLRNDLNAFGFSKVSMTSRLVEGYEEKTIDAYKQSYFHYLDSLEMDEKSKDSEKRLGFFWIPNVHHKDKSLKEDKPRIIVGGYQWQK